MPARLGPLRGSTLLWIAGIVAAAGLAHMVGAAAAIDRFVLDTGFAMQRRWNPAPAAIEPVIVGIDETFLASIDEPLTLSHVHLARFLRAMRAARPAVIGLDLVLPEKRFQSLALKTDPSLDLHETLLSALLEAAAEIPIVGAMVWDASHARFTDIQLDYAAALSLRDWSIAPRASGMLCADPDGRVRRYAGTDCALPASGLTFSGEASAAMGRPHLWTGLVDYRIGEPFDYVPIQRVLEMQARGDQEALQRLFKGRAVLLGLVLDDTDLLSLPVPLARWRPGDRVVPGVVAHAQLMRNMLNGGFIQPAAAWVVALLGIASLLFWRTDSVVRKFALLAAAGAGLLAVSCYLLAARIWLPVGDILIVGVLAGTGRSILEGWRTWRDKRRLTNTFSGYVSPAVLREIISGAVAAGQGGSTITICVLFSDIRNFTTMSEHLPAEEVVAILNRYFARMTEAVHRHGGTVDKFIGDGLMAFFGAPNQLPCPSRNAFACAQDMLSALAELNLEFAAEKRAPLAIGIGLHSGAAVVGHVGSPERHAYTAIGDTVNIAARLEGLCKPLGWPILCSESVAHDMDACDTLAPLGAQPLKGRSAIPVYGFDPAVQNGHRAGSDLGQDKEEERGAFLA
jgi:adenylate cyclase